MMKSLNGTENFFFGEDPVAQVVDFWRWQGADLLSNALRGTLAEFIVAQALQIKSLGRVEWDLYDLVYQGKKIEVKSTAYIQSWKQTKLSTPRFDIHKSAQLSKRASDIYVFCLFGAKVKENADPLNLKLWDFWVLSTANINRTFGEQKTVALEMIKPIASQTKYGGLKSAVDLVVDTL
jgi:hypothetical protein